MTIVVTVTTEGIARALGLTVEEYRRLRDGEPPPIIQSGKKPPGKPRFRFMMGDSRSGICPECAPHVGTLTTGDGTDGIPVPQLHLNCVCWLSPIAVDRIISDDAAKTLRQFEWMRTLSNSRLARVIGKVRAELLASGSVQSIEEFYDQDFMLRPLGELGFDQLGRPL